MVAVAPDIQKAAEKAQATRYINELAKIGRAQSQAQARENSVERAESADDRQVQKPRLVR